jgi:hypothetical protein
MMLLAAALSSTKSDSASAAVVKYDSGHVKHVTTTKALSVYLGHEIHSPSGISYASESWHNYCSLYLSVNLISKKTGRYESLSVPRPHVGKYEEQHNRDIMFHVYPSTNL